MRRLGSDQRIIRVPLLSEIIASPALLSHYQPILTLTEDFPRLGFEALARYTDPFPLATPDLLFEYAHRKKKIEDLDLACVERAMSGSRTLSGMLFINLQPGTLEQGTRLLELMSARFDDGSLDPGRLVFELTEHVTFNDVERATEAAARLRQHGIRFAFDDVGSGFSHLKLLERIQPEFIKLANEFGTDFEKSTFKKKIIEHQVALAHDFKASVILEGIETGDTAAAARDLGIELGQGWFFARPAPGEAWAAG